MYFPQSQRHLRSVVQLRRSCGAGGVGLFFTLFTLLVGISAMTEWRAFYVFLSFLESILTAIVVVKAWSWRKVKASHGNN